MKKIFLINFFRFVGGAYGKSNERDMMIELMNNGPIAVSFEPGNSFMYYEDGVYHEVRPSWMDKGEEQPEWTRVEHSVLLYGWGETEGGVKYWNLLNSWGERWGEGGSFRMKRGNDEMGIESMGEAADPIILRNGVVVEPPTSTGN